MCVLGIDVRRSQSRRLRPIFFFCCRAPFFDDDAAILDDDESFVHTPCSQEMHDGQSMHWHTNSLMSALHFQHTNQGCRALASQRGRP